MSSGVLSEALIDATEGDPAPALEAVANSLRDVVGLQLFRLSREGAAHWASVRVDSSLVRLVSERYASPDTNPVIAAFPKIRPGTLAACGALVDPGVYRRSEVYADFVVPAGSHHSGVALHGGPVGGSFATLGLTRGAAWFSGDERREAERLIRALLTACEIGASRITPPRPGSSARMSVSLDEGFQPLALARTVERALREHAVLGLKGGVVTCPGLPGLGLEAMRAALASRSVVRSVRRDRQGALWTVSLRRGPALPFGETFVLEVERPLSPPWSQRSLAEAYDLTAREADLVLALCGGSRTEAASAALGLTRQTVRTYLKRIYPKLGVGSQAELVAVLLGGAQAGGDD